MKAKLVLLAAVMTCAHAYADSGPTTNYVFREVLYGSGAQPDYADLCLISMSGNRAGGVWTEAFVGRPYDFLTAQRVGQIVGALQARPLLQAAEKDITQGKTCGAQAGAVQIQYAFVGHNPLDVHPLRKLCGPGLHGGASSVAGSLVSAMVDGWCGAPPATHN